MIASTESSTERISVFRPGGHWSIVIAATGYICKIRVRILDEELLTAIRGPRDSILYWRHNILINHFHVQVLTICLVVLLFCRGTLDYPVTTGFRWTESWCVQ